MPTILLINDHEIIAEALALVLEVEGFKVIRVRGGAKAIEYTLVIQPDVILCDLYTSFIHGTDVFRAIRQNPALAQTPVILLAMENGPWLRELLQEKGIHAILDKTLHVDRLVSMILELLSKTQVQGNDQRRQIHLIQPLRSGVRPLSQFPPDPAGG